jgi:hypothetical protein
MTTEQLQHLKEELNLSIADVVRTTVNGKIDKLTCSVETKFEAIHHRLDSQDLAIAPALETIQTFQSGRKFMVWMLPVFAFVGACFAVITAWFDKG